MRGQLTEHPLAELIREISSKNLSGTLRLDHERAKSVVYFEDGELIYAASNLRSLRLRTYLLKTNLATEKELDQYGENVSDLEMASRLVLSRRLREEQLDGLMEALVADVLRVAMLWTEGTWEFDERARLADAVRVKLSLPTLLREAGHRMPLKFISQRFRNPRERVSRAADVSMASSFAATESFILSRLDSPTTLDELVAVSGLRDLDAYQVIYGLALSGAVEREYWQHAFRADAARPKPVKPLIKPEAKQPGGSWGGLSSEAELEMFLVRVEGAENLYEVLGISQEASPDGIKDAYYSTARKYHPDRFRLNAGTPLQSRLSKGFAKVTQAYETLINPESRTGYDATLERTRRFAESTSAKAPPRKEGDYHDEVDADSASAEYNFKEGFGALQQGRINEAINYLAACARAVPNDARYRAYYGRALGANDRTRRLAENEIQAAVKIEPSNPNYRTMLAELFFELKFHKRAQTELDRALSLDPQNSGALLLQRKMERARKTG